MLSDGCFPTALVIVVAVGLAISLQGSGKPQASQVDSGPSEPVQGKGYRRIVSLSPSITECLFALGLGDRVVGVTDVLRTIPPKALTKSKVGGYYDLNYEAVVALRPDHGGVPTRTRATSGRPGIVWAWHT